MADTLSLRRLWTMYKRIAIASGVGVAKRDLAIAHTAFYAGVRGTLKVLAHLLEHGDEHGLRRTIERHGRQIRAIQGAVASGAAALIRQPPWPSCSRGAKAPAAPRCRSRSRKATRGERLRCALCRPPRLPKADLPVRGSGQSAPAKLECAGEFGGTPRRSPEPRGLDGGRGSSS